MIAFPEALTTTLAHAVPLGHERVELSRLYGRVLAAPVCARTDSPAFDNATFDGYGLRSEDVCQAAPTVPVGLRLCGVCHAGDHAPTTLGPGEAIRILTGAPIPPMVDAVIKQEECTVMDGMVWIRRAITPGESIRQRGGDYRRGEVLLDSGTRLSPACIGMLAAAGHASAPVFRTPRIGLLVTGNELIAPGQRRLDGCVYDANSDSLRAALHALGLRAQSAVAPDDWPVLADRFATLLETCDVVITAGGASVGDRDYISRLFTHFDVNPLFERVAMKPGKPTIFGVRQRQAHAPQLLFGLPGNPVSALLAYHQLVAPALRKMLGRHDYVPSTVSALLTTRIRKEVGRLEFVRGNVQQEDSRLVATPTRGQESHMLLGLAGANGLIHCPADSEEITAGASVTVQYLNWT